MSSTCILVIMMTRLNYYKVFWWFYYVDTRDIFVWFPFWVCLNYFQLLLVLIIPNFWLIVCLELRFWFKFVFFWHVIIFPFCLFNFFHHSLSNISTLSLLNFTLSTINSSNSVAFMFLSISISTIISSIELPSFEYFFGRLFYCIHVFMQFSNNIGI